MMNSIRLYCCFHRCGGPYAGLVRGTSLCRVRTPREIRPRAQGLWGACCRAGDTADGAPRWPAASAGTCWQRLPRPPRSWATCCEGRTSCAATASTGAGQDWLLAAASVGWLRISTVASNTKCFLASTPPQVHTQLTIFMCLLCGFCAGA
jgi:hypothetical protein